MDENATAMAVMTFSLPIFEMLFMHGRDLNFSSTGGQTPLLNLLQHETSIRWLLAHGADPNLGPPLSPQPCALPVACSGAVFDTAASTTSLEDLTPLLQHGANTENSLPLHVAAASASKADDESVPMAEYLLQLGTDVDGSDEARGFGAITCEALAPTFLGI